MKKTETDARRRAADKKRNKVKTVYYKDLLGDDYAGVPRKGFSVPGDFKYLHDGFWWRFCAFVLYRLIAAPAAWVFCKIAYGMKTVDHTGGAFKAAKRRGAGARKRGESGANGKDRSGGGFFLFGNHTLLIGDALTPTLSSFPRKAYVIVDPDNLSTRGTRTALMMLGALPRPETLEGFRAFNAAIGSRLREGCCISVYPEAHVWRFYTGIRPFPDVSFRFPVKENVPVFAATATYRRRKPFRLPKVTLHLDGPFYPDVSADGRTAAADLRNRVYETMCLRASESDYEHIAYRPAPGNSDCLKAEEPSQI